MTNSWKPQLTYRERRWGGGESERKRERARARDRESERERARLLLNTEETPEDRERHPRKGERGGEREGGRETEVTIKQRRRREKRHTIP